MTSIGRYGRSGLLILAASVGLALSAPAGAQIWPKDMKTDPPAEQAGTAPDADAPDDAQTHTADGAAAKDSDIKGLELDWSQLNVDASTLTWTPASKARVASPKTAPGTDASWSANDKADGSAAVSVK